MAHIDAANTLMFGSEDDSIFLSDYAAGALDSVTGLTTALPATLEDMGWVSEDGLAILLDDSTDKIKGHQGHGTVRLYMSDSSTSLEVTLLEAKAKTLAWNLGATVAKTAEGLARIVAPASRSVINLTGVIDAFDTSDNTVQWRVLFPQLALGARDAIPIKVGELAAFKFTLEVIGGFQILTNHKASIPAA